MKNGLCALWQNILLTCFSLIGQHTFLFHPPPPEWIIGHVDDIIDV